MPEVIDVVTISYSELASFDSSQPEKAVLHKIGEAYGPTGLGILAVRDVPNFSEKRRALLPLAAQLPTLPDLDACVHEVSLYSVGWSHGKEELAPGQPDTAKGSYYANPLVEDLDAALEQRDGISDTRKQQAVAHPEFYAPNVWPASLPELPVAFKAVGQSLHHVGCLVAVVCDAYCSQHGITTNIADTLKRSLNAKGRLLHYFSPDTTRKNENTKPWCGWHNDHGSLTGLVPGQYLDSEGNVVPCPDNESGLYVQGRQGEHFRVCLPNEADTCAFQIGESSQICSGGLLQATPHAVLSGAGAEGVSRESFALFLEPEFGTLLEIPNGKLMEECEGNSCSASLGLRPLNERWKSGQTFGDFHLATVSAFVSDS